MEKNMKQTAAILACLGLLAGCTAFLDDNTTGEKKMKTLEIRWQRLVNDKGETCGRCGATETAVADAVQKLKLSLKELGIDVVLEKSTLNLSTFKKAPLESNRIWIADKPLEDWLSASIGESQCCAACGDSDCRTMTIDGKTYEAIPPELIIKAGLMAGAQLLGAETPNGCSPAACTPKESSQTGPQTDPQTVLSERADVLASLAL